MGVCTKERKGVTAAVLMATPCTFIENIYERRWVVLKIYDDPRGRTDFSNPRDIVRHVTLRKTDPVPVDMRENVPSNSNGTYTYQFFSAFYNTLRRISDGARMDGRSRRANFSSLRLQTRCK